MKNTLRPAFLAILVTLPLALSANPGGAGQAAVGRIGIGDRAKDGRGGCTGVLVAPDVVLTATHCVTDPNSHLAADPATVFFAPAASPGTDRPTFRARLITLPSRPGPIARNRAFDAARVDLASPVPAEVALPLLLIAPEHPDEVTMLGYPADAAEPLAVLDACPVTTLAPPVLELACPARSGYSGGPVLIAGSGPPSIVAIMVARRTVSGREMTLAVIPASNIWPVDTGDGY